MPPPGAALCDFEISSEQDIVEHDLILELVVSAGPTPCFLGLWVNPLTKNESVLDYSLRPLSAKSRVIHPASLVE